MSWIGGLAEWQDGDVTYLSIAFTWKLDEAYSRALFAKACGRKVIAGGPALFLNKMQHELMDVAEIGKDYPDAVRFHNPLATIFAKDGAKPSTNTKNNICLMRTPHSHHHRMPDEYPTPVRHTRRREAPNDRAREGAA